MNRKKQILLCLLAVVLGAFLASCGNDNITYSVLVTDRLGAPYTQGVTVRFLQEQTQIEVLPIDRNGKAEADLPKGDYTALVRFTDKESTYTYDEAAAVLSEGSPQITVVANRCLGEKSELLSVGDKEYAACYVLEGCTEITLDQENQQFFLFAPSQAGTYQFSLLDTDAYLGYYGDSYFPRYDRTVEITDNTFSVSVAEDGFDLVLGVTEGAGKAVLAISRVGEAMDAAVAEEAPWNTDWQKPHQASELCRAEVTKTPQYFDITAKNGKYNLYYDEATGLYHLKKNGPVVLVALGANNNPAGTFTGLYERVCGNGMYGGSDVVRYFYDSNNALIQREKYTDALQEIFAHSGISAYDQEVYHPLTTELMYILQNGFASWWDPKSPDFQEGFANANPEYAWLFACCYVK